MDYTAFSVGLYSTWLYHAPESILFDAGEGVATHFANKVFAFDKIFLSHGHTDHIAGLPNLVNTRNLARGDKQKALTIYYPEDNYHVQHMIEYIDRSQRNTLTYPLKWVPLKPNATVPLEQSARCNRDILAFPTVHGGAPSLGFTIRESRERLRPEFQGRPGKELGELRRGGTNINERYTANLFCYSGDTGPIDPAPFMDVNTLVYEATIWDEKERHKRFELDREGNPVQPLKELPPTHSTVAEALALASRARAKELVLFHISGRYKDTCQEILGQFNPPFPVRLVMPWNILRWETYRKQTPEQPAL